MIELPTIVSARVRRRVPSADELPKKGTRLLAMNDAGEGRILAQQADAGVAHHQDQESGLTLREPELGDGLNAVFGSHNTPRRWHPNGKGHRIIHDLRGIREISAGEVEAAVDVTMAEMVGGESRRNVAVTA